MLGHVAIWGLEWFNVDDELYAAKAGTPISNWECPSDEYGVDMDVLLELTDGEMRALRRGAVHAPAAKATAGTAVHRDIFFPIVYLQQPKMAAFLFVLSEE